MNLHKLLIASLIFFVASCTTVRVGDKFGYRETWISYNPYSTKTNIYWMIATIIDTRKGWVMYRQNIVDASPMEENHDTFYDSKNNFLRTHKRIKK